MSTDSNNDDTTKPTADELDLLASRHPTFAGSICLKCSDHRTILSGKGSLFLLCQSKAAPANWPKYPPQPVSRCPVFREQS